MLDQYPQIKRFFNQTLPNSNLFKSIPSFWIKVQKYNILSTLMKECFKLNEYLCLPANQGLFACS